MNAVAIAPNYPTRPKIHRLPASITRPPKTQVRVYATLRRHVTTRPFLFSCSAVVAMAVLAVMMNGFISLLAYHVGTLHRMSDDISDAGSVVPEANAAALPIDKQKDTIVFADSNGSIVGQMARLPAPEGALTDINTMSVKTMSEVDKDSGRDLLSIVSKY